ncbi:amino acid adenylation domain-containing protein [Streptomyces sp. NPDC052114]|uniref:non-ribosomal peptide synthetase n=1 Tax=unclassified Streptomyces TaxID=2593676 RepID=UPI00343F36E4
MAEVAALRERDGTPPPYPFGPIQRAYLVGDQDGLDLRGPARYYLACDVDVARVPGLRGRLDRLVRAHAVLRLRVGDDLVPAPVADDATVPLVHREATEETFDAVDAEVRDAFRSDTLDLGGWPQLRLTVVRTPRRARLHLVYALWLMDAASLADFLAALVDPDATALLPAAPPPAAPPTGDRRRARDERYWRDVATSLPEAAEVPLRPGWRQAGRAVCHRMLRVDATAATALAERARDRGLTLPMVFLGVYGALLGAAGGDRAHTVTVVHSQRRHVGAGSALGNFGTTVPLAVPERAGRAFADLAREVQGRFLAHALHPSLSGPDIARLADPAADRRGLRHPFAFTSVELDSGREAGAGLRRVWDSVQLRVPQVLLDHQVGVDADGSVRLGFDWRADAFDDGFVDAFIDDYARAVAGLAAGESGWDGTREPLLPVRTTMPPLARGTETLHGRFLRTAGRRPDATAVRDATGDLTYADLAEAATALAARLVAAGAAPGDHVAVHVPRGGGQVVAVLGALLAGCVFVPLDHGLPPGRLDRITRQADVRYAVTGPDERDAEAWRGRGVCPVPARPTRETGRRHPLPDRSAPDVAYVIFTSGSTGEPKGVVIRHGAVLNTLDALNGLIGLGPADAVLSVSSIGFDLAVYDLFGPLLAGAAVVLLSEDTARTPAAWARAVKDHAVTVWNSTPPLASLLREEGGALPSVRAYLLSGDWIPLDLPGALRELSAGADVIGLGGATEGSIWSIHHRVTPADAAGRSIPYGTPLPGQDILVLDAQGHICPDWHIGEIHIAGAGVADGYLNDPERTAEAFAAYAEYGWVYRTGDRGRRGPDGVVEFLGRADSQVKVNGHRVELGEIEARLNALDHVRSSAASVTAHGGGIVAHVTLAPDPPADWPERSLAVLRGELPSYMVPFALVALDEIPLTANGKVDHRRLAAVPVRSAPRPPEDARHTGVHLQEVASCWAEVLGRPAGNEGFFASGGSSVEAIRLLSALRGRYGYEIPFGRFLADPTATGLAALCGAARDTAAAAVWSFAPRSVADPRGRVVLFPPVGGGVACYAELIRSLPGDLDVHVLGLDLPFEPAQEGEPDLADVAAACLRSLPPEVAGTDVPRLFAGWSFGGALAVEAARAAAYPVARVVVLDTPVSAAARHRDGTDADLLEGFVGDIREAGGVAVAAADVHEDPVLRDRFAVYRQNTRLLRDWRPGPVTVPLVELRAGTRPAEPDPGAWRRWSPTARAVALTGGHFDVLTTANTRRVRDEIGSGWT